MEKKISVKDLLMQAFLTGWELSDKSIAQDEYLQSAIQVIEVLQVEPENVYAEEGLGLTDGDEVDHLDDLLRTVLDKFPHPLHFGVLVILGQNGGEALTLRIRKLH